jgi:hypothetical protein
VASNHGGYFQSDFVKVNLFLEEMNVKSEVEKEQFYKLNTFLNYLSSSRSSTYYSDIYKVLYRPFHKSFASIKSFQSCLKQWNLVPVCLYVIYIIKPS